VSEKLNDAIDKKLAVLFITFSKSQLRNKSTKQQLSVKINQIIFCLNYWKLKSIT